MMNILTQSELYPVVSNIENCWLQIGACFSKKVAVFVDSPENYDKYKDYDIKILLAVEPTELWGSNEALKKCAKDFDIIMTWDEELLKLPNARLYLQPFTAYWIDVLNYNVWKKEYSVSTVVGAKNQTIGHKMRHELYSRQDEIKTPKRFFVSSALPIPNKFNNPYLGKSKEPLFDSMFHICIENVGRRKNSITEKLVDCFVTGTIPIHWGCTNLSDYFDTRGIIVAKDVDDIISICNQLTPEMYYDMKLYIDNNKRNGLKYFDIRLSVIKEIKALLKEKYGICSF